MQQYVPPTTTSERQRDPSFPWEPTKPELVCTIPQAQEMADLLTHNKDNFAIDPEFFYRKSGPDSKDPWVTYVPLSGQTNRKVYLGEVWNAKAKALNDYAQQVPPASNLMFGGVTFEPYNSAMGVDNMSLGGRWNPVWIKKVEIDPNPQGGAGLGNPGLPYTGSLAPLTLEDKVDLILRSTVGAKVIQAAIKAKG